MMILSRSTCCLLIFLQSLSCGAAAVCPPLLLFQSFSTGRVGASTDSWPSELKRTQSIIAMFGFVLFWTVTIGHPDPEHFPHASHLGNILSNILLSHAANSPGLPVGTPAAGASKRPQSYTLRLRSLASALGQGRA